jgi:hypothetical protein
MRWVFDVPELASVFTKAVDEGWDENRLRGAVFATDWFKVHGTMKVSNDLKAQADAYLVPMDDQSRRNWALKIITQEVQPAEFTEWAKGQAKSMFAHNPELVKALDRGVTVTDYAAPYRAVAAQTLELAPEAIDLNEAKWRRALDGVADEKGQRMSLSLSDWQTTLRTDPTYRYDYTRQAREQSAQFQGQLLKQFGAIA